MKSIVRKLIFLLLIISLTSFCVSSLVLAAPIENMILEMPNKYVDEKGNVKESTIKVSVSGDEFYRQVTTLSGYTLIEDKDSGSVCYANLNSKGELISTKVPYTGLNTQEEKSIEEKLTKGIKESNNVIMVTVNKNRELLGRMKDDKQFLDSIKRTSYLDENKWQYGLEDVNNVLSDKTSLGGAYDPDAMFWKQATAFALNPKDLDGKLDLGSTSKRERLNMQDLGKSSSIVSQSGAGSESLKQKADNNP